MKKSIILIIGLMTLSYGLGYDKWVLGDTVAHTIQKANMHDIAISYALSISSKKGFKASQLPNKIEDVKKLGYSTNILDRKTTVWMFFNNKKKINKIEVFISTYPTPDDIITGEEISKKIINILGKSFNKKYGKYKKESIKFVGTGYGWKPSNKTKVFMIRKSTGVEVQYIHLGNKSKQYIKNTNDLTKF